MRTRGRERRLPETKRFVLTSEFWAMVVAIAGLLFADYVLHDIANPTAWRFSAFVAMAYIVSRGIAKAGSQREYQQPWTDRGPAPEPRTAADDEWAERRSSVYGEPERNEASPGTRT
jgi:hypothetical protein